MSGVVNSLPWATIGVFILAAIVTIIGGIGVLNGSLEFDHYIAAVTGCAGSLGLLGVGRGLAARSDSQPPAKGK